MRLLVLLLLAFVPLLADAQVQVQNLPLGSSIISTDATICNQPETIIAPTEGTNKCTYSQVLAFVQGNLISGSITPGDCVKWLTSTTIGDFGSACGGGGGLAPSGSITNFTLSCWASGTTLSSFTNGTAGQILVSNGAGSCPSFQSGTTYPGLPSDPSAIAPTDLIALYSQANTELTTVVPPLLSLFVGTNSLASATSITPSCAVEDNFSTNTVTGGTFTVNAPTGCTPAEGQKLLLHIKFTNAQTYSWNAAFVGGTTALPTTSTGTSKGDWIAFRYDSINAKWDYLASAAGF